MVVNPGLLNGRLRLFVSVGIANLLAVTVGMMLAWSSPILEKLKTDNNDNPLDNPITPNQESWIGSLLPLGASVGPFLVGYLQDSIGRKYTLFLIAIPFIVAYLLAAFANVVTYFYFVRILAGLSVGATYTVLPTYIAESTDVSVRGMLGASMTNFLSLGMLISYCMAPYISIRMFNTLEAIVPVAMIILTYFIPESPYFLVAKSKTSEAEDSLRVLRSKDIKDVQVELREIEESVANLKKERGTFLDIFKTKGTTKAFVISISLCILSQLCGINIVLFYTQSIFEEAGMSIDAAIPPIIIGGVQFVGSFITPAIVDKSGRKILLLISAIGMLVAEVPLGVYFHLQRQGHDVESISWIPIATLIIFIISYNGGFGALPWVIIAEIMPSNLKAAATPFAASSSFLVSFALSYLYNSISDGIGIGGSFWICAGCAVLAFLFVLIYVPETKGKSFQEIQKILNS